MATFNNLDSVLGTAQDDQITGTAGNDTMQGGQGNDALDGLSGKDVALYKGESQNYTVTLEGEGSITVKDTTAGVLNEGTDALTNVEIVRFTDSELSVSSIAERIGATIKVNTFKDAAQENAAGALLSDGSYVIVWQSQSQDQSGWGIYGQHYDSAGSPIGTEFQVNTYTESNQERPAIAALHDGGFVVTWDSEGQDSGGRGIYGQRYDSVANRVGNEFIVNNTTGGNQDFTAVAALSEGGFIVAWVGQDQSGQGIFAKRYNSAGNPIDGEFLVNSDAQGDQKNPSLVSLEDGGFVVVWADVGSRHDIYGQRYSASGEAIGSRFLVNTHFENEQGYPKIASLSSGGFVVTWASWAQDSSQWGIYGQVFTPDGEALGSEFKVNSFTNNNQGSSHSLIGLDGGGFVSAWTSEWQLNWWDVFAQRFENDGTRIGTEFLVNASTQGAQGLPTVIGTSDGGFIVAFQERDGIQADPDWGISTQRFSVVPELVGGDSGDALTGGAGNQGLSGGGGDDTLQGGAGNDTIDGGAGFNTAVFVGRPDFFNRKIIDGRYFVTDTLADEVDEVDGSDEGRDEIRNIQVIRYVTPEGEILHERHIDDYTNLLDADNTVDVGEKVSGKVNYLGDRDVFLLDIESQQEFVLIGDSGSDWGPQVSIAGRQFALRDLRLSSQQLNVVTVPKGQTAIEVFDTNPNTASPLSSRSYSFALLRLGEGTTANDSISTDNKFDLVRAGLGNDSITGTSRSEYFFGEEGRDTIVSGGGSDFIDGGSGENTAVLPGNMGEYKWVWSKETPWSDNMAALKVTHTATDSVTWLKNINIIQFQDQAFSPDPESSVADGAKIFSLGSSIEGSIFATTDGSYEADIDYFRQLFSDVDTTDTVRIRFELLDSSNARLRFTILPEDVSDANAWNSRLKFFNSETSETRDEFNVYQWNRVYEFYGSPTTFGSSRDFEYSEPTVLRVTGEVQGLDSARYRISVDLVEFGTSGDDRLTSDGRSTVLIGGAGNDSLIGSDGDDEFDGGIGDDTLQGGLGNDVLVDISGANLLEGGGGDDLFEPGANASGTIVGGDGIDTLVVSPGFEWNKYEISGIEALDARGGEIFLSSEALRALGFVTLNNVSLRIAPTLKNQTLDLSAFDGNASLRGTSQSDKLIAGGGNNQIYVNSGNGDGSSGLGVDTVDAGGGDDYISWSTINSQRWHQWASDFGDFNGAKTFKVLGSWNGGEGIDTVGFDFTQRYWYFPVDGFGTWQENNVPPDWAGWGLDISGLELDGIEIMQFKAADARWASPSFIVMTLEQMAALDAVSGVPRISIVGGGTLDISKLNDLGITNWNIGDSEDYTLTGTPNSDVLRLGEGVFNVDLGTGDDRIIAENLRLLKGTIDGGDGNDKLTLSGMIVDISQSTILNFEAISANATSISLTQEQYQALSSLITSTGSSAPKYTLALENPGSYLLSEYVGFSGLRGTSGNDELIGSNLADILIGGEGQDTLVSDGGSDTLIGGEGIDRAVFSGSALDYALTAGPDGQTLSVEHTKSGVTAILDSIEEIEFTDLAFSVRPSVRDAIVVNQVTNSSQSSTFIHEVSPDKYLILWQSSNQTGQGKTDILGRFYSPELGVMGSEFLINSQSQWRSVFSDYNEADIRGANPAASLSDGRTVVVYAAEHRADNNWWGVAGRFISADGSPIGSEFYINSTATGRQDNVSVLALDSDDFVVVWTDSGGADGSGSGIFAQRFDSQGNRVGVETQLNLNSIQNQRSVSVAALDSGGFVAAWRDDQQNKVIGRVFDASLNGGTEFEISSNQGTQQVALAAAPDGGFWASWTAWWQAPDNNQSGIFLQKFSRSGDPLGAEISVNSYTVGDQTAPNLSVGESGEIVVTWQSIGQDGSGTGVYAQLFDGNGQKVGGETLLNTNTTGSQLYADVSLSSRGYTVVWESNEVATNGSDIYVRSYDFNTGFGALTIGSDADGNLTTVQNGVFSGLVGGADADILRGNDNANVIITGGGDDTVVALGGDDRIFAGAGIESIQAGSGDDSIYITNKSASQDFLDGGPGNDRLLLSDFVDLSGAKFSGIETLSGGETRLLASQLSGFSVVSGSTVELVDSTNNVTIPEIDYSGAIIRQKNYDPEIAASSGWFGTADSDSIVGGSSSDQIYAGRGADLVSGLGGNDLIVGGGGRDTLHGGLGDDVFEILPGEFSGGWSSFEYLYGNTRQWFNGERLVYSDSIQGGEGTDTLRLSLPDAWRTGFVVTPVSIASLERIEVSGARHFDLFIDAATWSSLAEVSVQHADNQRYFQLRVVGKGESFSLSTLVTPEALQRAEFFGLFDSIDLSSNLDARTEEIYAESFNSLYTGSANDKVTVQGDPSFVVNLGSGDDLIRINNISAFSGTIDGGDGDDTLEFTNSWGLIDLSASTILNIETIKQGGTRLLVSREQFADLEFEGTGSIFVSDGGVISATAENDVFNGTGSETISGGRGDDQLSFVREARFSGNMAEYDGLAWGEAGSYLVQHVRGTPVDGTDTLVNVLQISFADTPEPIEIDDHFSLGMGQSGLDLSVLSAITFGKRVSAKTHYQGDQDSFRMELAPNSPVTIESSVSEGTNRVHFDFYVFDENGGRRQLQFQNTKDGNYQWGFSHWMQNSQNTWLPGFQLNGKFVPFEGGEVVVHARTDSVGDYDFTVVMHDDYIGSESSTAMIDPASGRIKGYIGEESDQDWVGTQLVAGTQYRLDLKALSSGAGTLAEGKISLHDVNGRKLADGLGSTLSGEQYLIFTPTEDGTYFLNISDATGLYTGSWEASQQSVDTVRDNITSSASLMTNQGVSMVRSEVNYAGDRDWFRVWLDRGVTYEFNGVGESLGDPRLTLYSATGNLVAIGVDAEGKDDRLIYRSGSPGWFFISVGGGGTDRGTYELSVGSIADDWGQTATGAGKLEKNVIETGLIGFSGDRDWFKVGLSKGQYYVIDLKADLSSESMDPMSDPLLVIRDSAGLVVLTSDDSPGSLDARAYFSPATDGVFYLEARSAYRYDTGAYTIKVSDAPKDDFESDLSSALGENPSVGQLTVGATGYAPEDGKIEIPSDVDFFKVSLEGDKTYYFEARGFSTNSGTLADPRLRVFDSSGRLVSSSDDGGLGANAALYLDKPAPGVYFVEVSSAKPLGMGSYEVSVSQRSLPSDEAGSDVSTGAVITLGGSLEGSLSLPLDTDWFRANLIAGQDYVFRLYGAGSGLGSLGDPELALYDAAGALISVGLESYTTDDYLVFTPTTGGTYYLGVNSAIGSETGSYTLVARGPDDHGNSRNTATELTVGAEAREGAIQWSSGSFGMDLGGGSNLITDVDSDWFAFEVTKGQVLSVVIEGTAGSSLSRPMVEVLEFNGSAPKTLVVGDGLEVNSGAAVASWRAEKTGTVYARVTDGAGTTGAYTIQVRKGDESDEDRDGSIGLTFVQSSDGVLSAVSVAKIGLVGDVDIFTAQLEKGRTYRIETMAVRDGNTAPLAGARMDATFVSDRTDDAEAEFVENNGNERKPSVFDSAVFTPSSSGEITIAVSGQYLSYQTGQYKLRVIDLGVSSTDLRPDSVSKYSLSELGYLSLAEGERGAIDTKGDLDLYAVSLTSGNLYEFSVRGYGEGLGTLVESQLLLRNAVGQLVSVGQIDPLTGRTDLQVSVFEDGTYYLEVSGAGKGDGIGTFFLETSVRDYAMDVDDDISSDTSSGLILDLNKSVYGEINFDFDTDWIGVDLVAGDTYVINLVGAGDGREGLKDGYLRLIGPDGSVVSADDNSGPGSDSRLTFVAAVTGRFFVEASSANGELGSYSVDLRKLYSGIADPLQSAQWYRSLMGLDQLEGQYSGSGVTIGMIDDGIDTAHPDLTHQIDFAQSFDTVSNSKDGSHKIPYPINPWGDFHGTLVAGLMVSEAFNETGIVGVANDADLASIRVKWTWQQMAEALALQHQFDVSNNSWGSDQPFTDNFNLTTLSSAQQAIRKGVEQGRDGLGTVFVFSAGNSGSFGDNTNYHNFQNAREVITVGAVDQTGAPAGFSTQGATVLVGAYGVDMITTDRSENGQGMDLGSDYLTNFTGTSAAAPLVSGVVALMLEANPNLGYRDVQKILALTATQPNGVSYKTNGAAQWNLGGLRFNDAIGFGVVDAYAAVMLAETWTETNTAQNEVTLSARAFGMNTALPDATTSGAGVYTKTFTLDGSMTIDRVDLGIDLRHARLGDLIIELTSPSGTTSTLFNRPSVTTERPLGLEGIDSPLPNHLIWTLSSAQFLGEKAQGQWTVTIRDASGGQAGQLYSLSLKAYGSADGPDDTFVLTESGFEQAVGGVLADEAGLDTINAAAMRSGLLFDLQNGEVESSLGGFVIAEWTTIENVVGGSGDDIIVGNEASNRLEGRSGSDEFYGSAGNDTIDGGRGADILVYEGSSQSYQISFDPVTKAISVTYRVGSADVIDTLFSIEQIQFSDEVVSLASTVGNRAPTMNRAVFDRPVELESGVGVQFVLPNDAFIDQDLESAETSSTLADLDVSAKSEQGGELPAWLVFDPVTKTFSGTPPEGFEGQLKVLIEALDEFGEKVEGILTFQWGDNMAPVTSLASDLSVAEDSGLTNLSLIAPVDPEGTEVTVEISEVPSFGRVLKADGSALKAGDKISAALLEEVFYETGKDQNGAAGTFSYRAIDADGVESASSVSLYVSPVNDAPDFGGDSVIVMRYPEETSIALELTRPVDAESPITTLTVTGLPDLGVVTRNGTEVKIGDILRVDDLTGFIFSLNVNANGPVGGLKLSATDPQGASTSWTLTVEVQGEGYSNSGTEAADKIYGSSTDDSLYGLAGSDLLVANGGNDKIFGGAGQDTLLGGGGNDTLDGGSGEDTLDGGVGIDIMMGGPGNDLYLVDHVEDQVIEVLARGAGGTDTVITEVSLVAPENIEYLTAASDAGSITLTGNLLSNRLVGNRESNTLLGGMGADTLLGLEGNDTLDGGSGADRMAAGLGDDLYVVDSRFDAVLEFSGEGFDTVLASASFTLPSHVENLTLTGAGDFAGGGNSLDNHIKGNAGNNTLSGGLGLDTLEGGLGDDTYILTDSGDLIIDEGGMDTIKAPSSIDLSSFPMIEAAELIGMSNSTITGNSASNNLVGNPGDNLLEGGLGQDTLIGGEGGDGFLVGFNGQGYGGDLIEDFNAAEDLLMIDLASFGLAPSILAKFESGLVKADQLVIGINGRPVAADENDHFLLDQSTGSLWFDPDGNGELEAYEVAKLTAEAAAQVTNANLYMVI